LTQTGIDLRLKTLSPPPLARKSENRLI